MNALAFAEPADACRQEDHSRSALDFIHQLLSAAGDEKRTLSALLGELARAFDSAGAGLAAPQSAPLLQHQQWIKPNRFEPMHYPWDTRPEIIEQAKNEAMALAVPEPRVSWLVTTVWPTDSGGWLLWLQDEPRRRWSASEQA